MRYAYLFEARGIQRFLFASGKLKDMLGGSELLDYLCAENGLLSQTLEKLGLNPDSPRQAGGAFYLLFDHQEDAQRLRAVWRLACARWIPGVEQVDALTQGNCAREAIRKGIEQLHKARNQLQADLPRPGPLVERSPRTGLAAVLREGKNESKESLDAATARQRRFERPANSQKLEQRFLNEPGFIWPVNFEEDSRPEQRFPLGERRLVALIHADGNGLGELLRILNEACQEADDKTYVELYRTFSDGLTQATLAAARQACHEVLLPQAIAVPKSEKKVLPARPLVLGGDDLTILVRADLALAFTRAFLNAFEQHSTESMSRLHRAFEQAGLHQGASELPDRLTACAGICFMKCSQPFHAGHELAESLCKQAKKESRKARAGDTKQPMPATLAMHKVQDSLLEDAERQFEQNYCIQQDNKQQDNKTGWQLALSAYALKPQQGLPTLDDLEQMVEVFSSTSEYRLNDRPLRELATLWHADITLARQRYQRWRDLANKNNASALDQFDTYLQALVGSVAPDLPCNILSPAQSPLADLLNLLSLQTNTHQPEEVRP